MAGIKKICQHELYREPILKYIDGYSLQNLLIFSS